MRKSNSPLPKLRQNRGGRAERAGRIAEIAKRLGKRARVMLRVTSGIHAGGHEFVSTAHEDQKFGVALLPVGADASKLNVLDDLADVTPAGRTHA